MDLCMAFWPYQSIWYSQSWASLENYGEVWLSYHVHSNGEAVPRWYACTGPKWWWAFWSIPCDKSCQARLCTSPILFSMVFSAMLTDGFQYGDNGIPIRYRFDGKFFNLIRLQAKSKVQIEVLDEFLFADEMAKGAPEEEKMQKSVDQVSDLWRLWPHNQHQKDRGGLSTSSWQALQGAHHCSERSKIASGRQIHLPWKHIVKSRAHWWWSQCLDCQDYQSAPGKPYKEPTIAVKDCKW